MKIKIGIRVDKEKGFEDMGNYLKYFGIINEEVIFVWES